MFEALRHKELPKLVKNADGLIDYVAFDAKDRSRRLRIKRALGAAHAPDYRYLLDISYDDKGWTDFVLTYSFMQVQVTGKNLQNIIVSIENNSCGWIQEFDSGKYSQPQPEEAIIETIEIVAKEIIGM